jgi:polyribonucleotide nucleotidyltransferase
MKIESKKFQTTVNDKMVVLEVSQLAEQANAAVLGHYGGTVVLATVVMGTEDRDIDYLPLMVDFEERFYAVGKILGSQFIRREGRSSENAILSGRLIDRTIRPLFNHNIRRDIQVVVTTVSLEEGYDAVFIGLLAASAALSISDIPWDGPVAGVKINSVLPASQWEAFISGTTDKINMIELSGLDASEGIIIDEFEKAAKIIPALIDLQNKMTEELGKPKASVALAEPDPALREKIKKFLQNKLEPAIYVQEKIVRNDNLAKLQEALLETLDDREKQSAAALKVFEEEADACVHKNILEAERRPDLRKLDQIRDLRAEVGLFERLHGSALFIRGNTQALAVTTLASPDAEQKIEGASVSGKKRFMLHYNFPKYSTGEVGPFRGPGRREIGHGSLAEKALKNLLPSKDDFPYTIRLVSEILSSNGSSSMASVCAGCLSLMDAGVPIKKTVAGIAMGLMSDDSGHYKILTDIQGPEDHYGDMDFKIAGTKDGVTAVQMDVKIGGITTKIVAEVLARAKKARLEIIDVMEKTLEAPRKYLSPHAPVILVLTVDPAKIGEIIGPGGKIINGIIAQTGVTAIDIEQEGKVFVVGPTKEIAERALKQVEAIVHEYQVGEVVEGTVVKILDFGAIVEFGPGRDGMIHVSELKEGYVKKVEDVVKVGDFVRARIIKTEPEGRIGLSLRGLK